MNRVCRCMQYLLDATNTISLLTPCRTALLAKPVFTQRSEILLLLGNPNVHHRVHKGSSPLNPVVNHAN